MLPVNFAHEEQTTVSLYSIAVKRYIIASFLNNSGSIPGNVQEMTEISKVFSY